MLLLLIAMLKGGGEHEHKGKLSSAIGLLLMVVSRLPLAGCWDRIEMNDSGSSRGQAVDK